MAKKLQSAQSQCASSPLQKFVNSTASHHTRAKFNEIVVSARNLTQKKALRSFRENDITILTGPAGTGKTYLPTLIALEALVNEEISKIVIVRPSVQVEGENDIGALPGDILGKFGPQVKPVTDTLQDYLGLNKLNQLIMNEVIEIVPVAFIRGRSLKNTWILVDEAQNLSETAMKAVLTRLDEGSKMAVSGDIEQSDRSTNNGLVQLIDLILEKNPENIGLVEFDQSEVVRHEAVKAVLKLYD